jgi:NADH-quinone oxidoreductase subunit N
MDSSLIITLWPELLLLVASGVLFMLGLGKTPGTRRIAPVVALISLALVAVGSLPAEIGTTEWATLIADDLTKFIRFITASVGILLVLLSWPTTTRATGNAAYDVGSDVGEHFALLLLSLTGLMLTAGANDMITLFLAIELASVPTYIMVSIARKGPAAQEAGVKYFYLGAMSAAVLLLGFSYLYGVTGQVHFSPTLDTNAPGMSMIFHQYSMAGEVPATALGPYAIVGVVIVILGLCFKLAAVPMHVYAADVYQGAATPVTAVLSFVPKAVGLVALIKILRVVGGESLVVPQAVVLIMAVIAAATMTVGNLLAVMQLNVKRVLAYSSVAHSGYLLVGITAALATPDRPEVQAAALQAVLFYIGLYGIMNIGAFGVLQSLPARAHGGSPRPAGGIGAAETFEDIAGQGKNHPLLGLGMAICCLSLMGLPITVGFLGKVYLLIPTLKAELYLLAGLLVLNSAISATYYLKIVGQMFLRVPPAVQPSELTQPSSRPARLAVAVSAIIVVGLGTALPATQWLLNRAGAAAGMTPPPPTASANLSTPSSAAVR